MSEKKKYIASLSSLGTSKKQIFKIFFIEGTIITAVAVPIGLLISYGVDYLLINIFDNLFKSIQGKILNTTLEATKNVDLHLIFSGITIFSSIILVTIIVWLSILAPTINASKTTIIDMIRKNKFNKISKKLEKVPKFITKLFNINGELAYKNIKRSRYKFISMTVSLTISIILFISITGYIENLEKYNELEKLDYNYKFYLFKNNLEDKDYSTEIIDVLNQFDLINSIYGKQQLNAFYLILDKDNINDSLKNASKEMVLLSNILGKHEDGSIQLLSHVITFDDKTYKEYLEQVGLETKLDRDECVLVNYSNVHTKYYDGLYLTNYKSGDKLTLNTVDRDDNFETVKEFSEKFGASGVNQNKELELNIKAVTNIMPKGAENGIYGNEVYLVVNQATLEELWYKQYGFEYPGTMDYYINSSSPNKIDELVNTLNRRYNGLTRVVGTNLFTEQQENKNQKLIREIMLYSFLILMCTLSIINVFNIIVSNITSRKNEFAELESIGMSKRSISKMMMLEGAFYGIISLILGFIISIIILYILYTRMIWTEMYGFSVSIPIFMCTVLMLFSVIYLSILYGKRKIDIGNISDSLKKIM